jgi:hypothetical protein
MGEDESMNKNVLGSVLIAMVAIVGCGDDTFGTGGSGGGTGGAGGVPVIGPLTWTTSDITVVGDECEFLLNPEEDVPAEFEITIVGSTVIMDEPGTSLEASTDNYSPELDEVLLTGLTTNDEFPPCVVELDDAFELVLDDPDLSLDENTTVQVTWNHVESDVSDNPGDCEGEWFVPLPCVTEATFTLTQQVE